MDAANEPVTETHEDTPDLDRGRTDWVFSTPFLLFHVAAVVGVALTGWSWRGLALAVGLYYVRMFAITAGFHRYFSHRTFRTSRWFQFVLAFWAMTSLQKGVLWWAAHHRVHHKYSDLPGDVHSMKREGFLWSHVGWILSTRYHETDVKRIPDLMKFPELVWLNKWHWVPGTVLGVATYLLGGGWALLWGFLVSTVLLWHGTFCINSITHWLGRRRYRTTDESRNSLILALVTLGEGWHNNHHYYQRATNQGFFWWEIDITFYVLKLLSWVGVVWDLHTPPPHVLAANRERDVPRSSVPAPAA